jgi:peptidoglycan LD-endopeptidase LytH
MKRKISLKRKIFLIIGIVIMVPLILPQRFVIPVDKATQKDYNPKTFWFYPWGKSITHKGVDIFAKEGTPVVSSTSGFVIYAGQIELGGNVILILGPKWRLHYYAHLKDIRTKNFSWKKKGVCIGTVGTSGNAKGKAPHLHYAIITPIPYIWRIERNHQGWKKMFYLNPIDYMHK